LSINRNYYPKLKLFNKFIVFSWDFVINFIFINLNKLINIKSHIYSFISYYIDLSSCLALKKFFNNMGSLNIVYNKEFDWNYDFKYLFFFNKSIEELEHLKFFLFISCDIRLESPLLNIRIKKNYNVNKNNELFLYSYGLALKHLTYPLKFIGNCIFKFLSILRCKQRFLCDLFFKDFISNSFFL